jgi:hypothetical protein
MSKKIYLRKENIEEMLEILNKFPDVKALNLIHKRCSGIGDQIDIEFDLKQNDVMGLFKVEIVGPKDW